MVKRNELLNYVDELLQTKTYQDFGPNGLQVEGQEEIKKIITGVSACQALFDEAVKQKADTVLVHHGFFWQKEDARVILIKKKRLATLLRHDINLIGYHLPLDMHPVYGNNVLLAKMFDFSIDHKVETKDPTIWIFKGRMNQPKTPQEFSKLITEKLNRKPLHIPGKSEKIHTIAWCSGGAGMYTNLAAELGVDAYLTGEISENVVHIAREFGMHLFAAGHHATERCGIKLLGEHLAEKFNVSYEFIDIDNPI